MTQDIVTAHSTHVACEGNGPVTGHPKVYLQIESGKTEVTCPYCSRQFKLDPNAKVGGH